MKLTKRESLYLQAKEAYYEGNPIMEDAEFDVLESELKGESSPAIEMVGFKTKGVKYSHLTPMKSLDKIQFRLIIFLMRNS
jgi:NAD-dependent DNA ligase